MAQKKKNKKILNFPKVKKELKDFMADDQGKMTRKDVAKLGVSLAVLGMMMQPESADAQTCTTTGTSCCGNGGETTTCTPTHSNSISTDGSCAAHNNVTAQQTTHCDHCDGGWLC